MAPAPLLLPGSVSKSSGLMTARGRNRQNMGMLTETSPKLEPSLRPMVWFGPPPACLHHATHPTHPNPLVKSHPPAHL